MVVLWLLLFLICPADGDESLLSVHLPANRLSDQLDVVEMAPMRRYLIEKPTRFRVIWNPSVCADPQANATATVLSFLPTWESDYHPSLDDILENAFVFTAPQHEPYPIGRPWEREFRQHLRANLKGRPIAENKFITLRMDNGGFEAQVEPGRHAVLYFFDRRNGSVVHQMALPLSPSLRYMSLFSRLEDKCPVFFSQIDENFDHVVWRPAAAAGQVRDKDRKFAAPSEMDRICFHYTACLLAVFVSLIVAFTVVPNSFEWRAERRNDDEEYGEEEQGVDLDVVDEGNGSDSAWTKQQAEAAKTDKMAKTGSLDKTQEADK